VIGNDAADLALTDAEAAGNIPHTHAVFQTQVQDQLTGEGFTHVPAKIPPMQIVEFVFLHITVPLG